MTSEEVSFEPPSLWDWRTANRGGDFAVHSCEVSVVNRPHELQAVKFTFLNKPAIYRL